MPNKAQTHIDKALTNISIAYLQNPSGHFADKVFPQVPVQKQSDRYFVYDKGDWLRDEMTERANATESDGGDFNIDNTPTYYCRVYAYHKDITDRDRANADTPIDLDRDITEFLTEKGLIKKDTIFVANFLKAGVWDTDLAGVSATPGAGQFLQWNDANSDPIGDIKNGRIAIQKTTGYKPNVLLLGAEVFEELLEHPDVIDRVKYTALGQGSESILATLFRVNKIVVAESVKNSAVQGATDAIDFIGGKKALLVYAEPRPGILKPSAGYIFTWTGIAGNKMGVAMNKIPMPLIGQGGTRIEIEMAFDMKVVATDLGCYFGDAIA